MSATLLGAVVAAATLGVTHAIEPDHVAGISSLTGRRGSSRASALAGACFSLGHVALVVVWLGAAYLLLGDSGFSPAAASLGTLGAGLILGVLGLAMAATGIRTLVRKETHTHTHAHDGDGDDGASASDDHGHEHYHFHLPADRLLGDRFSLSTHDHTLRGYLKTGLVGALFTLSPPISMMAFVSAVLPRHGGSAILLVVAAYAVSITLTMSLIGAGVGTVFGLTRERGTSLHGVAQLVGAVLVVGLAATMVSSHLGTLV